MRSANRHRTRGRGGVALRGARRTAPGIERGGKSVFAHSQKNRRRRSTAVGVKIDVPEAKVTLQNTINWL